jgi:hypothetical protein
MAVKKASDTAIRMIEPNLSVFITETTYCMFTGSEKSQQKVSTNDKAESQCFYNRDNLLYVYTSQSVKIASEKAV